MSATHLPPKHRGIFVLRRLIGVDGKPKTIKAGPLFNSQVARRNDIIDARLQGFYFPEIRPHLAYEATNFITSQVVSFRALSSSEEAIADNFRQLVKDGKISYTYEQNGSMQTTVFRHCYLTNTVALTRNGSAFILVGLK